MCFVGGAEAPKAVPAPVTAASSRRRKDVENRALRGYAATILGSTTSGVGATSGASGRLGELKTVLGA
jgi:hypothetical protein